MRNPTLAEQLEADPIDFLAKVEDIMKENNHLRYLLAKGSDPCAYCALSKNDMAKCVSGFPGCARADDLLNGPIEVPNEIGEKQK